MNTNNFCPSGFKNLFLFLVITATGIGSASAQVCSNGSAVDCNPAGSTLIASSAFVDPTPPEGYTQCAGFINTAGDDVRWDWENNCAALVDGTGGGLFMRVYDDATGAILSGARLYAGVPLYWVPSTGFNFRADLNEGEGFLDNPVLDIGHPGTSLAFSDTDVNYCGCGRPPSGSGTCNDVYAATAADDKIFYVGGNSSNDAYEAVYGPPGGKGTCSLSNEIVALRVAIYAGESTAEPSSIARFAVTKDFSDNNPEDVSVSIRCNGGLPLEQSFVISDSQSAPAAAAAAPAAGVTFVVKSFVDGEMDCTITETPVHGYLPGYTASGDSDSVDDDPEAPGCHFNSVNFEDTNSCVISNVLDRVYFDLTKKWELGDEYADADKVAEVEIFIENFRGRPDGDLQDHSGVLTIGDETRSFFVLPNFGTPQTRVRVVELPTKSSIESDQGCADWIVFNVGDDRKSCTITNTAFYEGIPTLSHYSLATLVILILGVGFIGFRRFT